MMIAALTVAALLGFHQQSAGPVVPLTLGQAVGGDLAPGDRTGETGAYFDCFSFSGRARQALTVRLRSSDFDPMLVLRRGPTCDGNLLYVARGTNGEARVRTDLNYDEVYSLKVQSENAGETGTYNLTLGEPPAPVQQPPARQQPVYKTERVRAGCGYVTGTDHLFPIEVGLFFDDEPIADDYGQSVRVNGRWTHPDQSPHADARTRPWYRDNEPVTVGGRDYVKYGLPRVLGLNEVEWFAEFDGLAVVAEPGETAPEVIYVLVGPAECGFQPYQRRD